MLLIPFFFGFLLIRRREEVQVEVRGRDTDVPAPVNLCASCQRQLRPPATWLPLLLAALLLVTSGALAYLCVVGEVCVVVIGVALVALIGLGVIALLRMLAVWRWQRSLKALLRKVPVYRQVLARYPRPVIVVPAPSHLPNEAGSGNA